MIIIFTDSVIVSGIIMMISLKMAAKFAISLDNGRKVTQ